MDIAPVDGCDIISTIDVGMQDICEKALIDKLKDEASADEKLAAMNDFKKAIEALPAKIPVIRKIEVGLNINPAETFCDSLGSVCPIIISLSISAKPDRIGLAEMRYLCFVHNYEIYYLH